MLFISSDRKPCVSSSFNYLAPIGLELPTQISKWDRKDNIGAILTNVQFISFDNDEECSENTPFNFRIIDDNKFNHFQYTTILHNVTIDGSKFMNPPDQQQNVVKDIVIHDNDGSTDPLGEASHGMIVSNLKYLTAFTNDTCTRYPSGSGGTYCPNACYRTVSFLVDQNDSELIDLRVTRQSDGKHVLVPFTYKYDDELHYRHYSENYRSCELKAFEN